MIEGALVANLQKMDVLDQLEDESRRRAKHEGKVIGKGSDILGKKTLKGAQSYAEKQESYFEHNRRRFMGHVNGRKFL